MVARANTVAFQGIEVVAVDVQVQMAAGLPAFTLVGLPDKAVAESRERVRAALSALGLALPPKRIIINLAPTDLLKEGSHFDLPIALGLLAAMGVLPEDEIAGHVALGELALDGRISPVAGVLPAAIHALASERGLICPAAQGGPRAFLPPSRGTRPRRTLGTLPYPILICISRPRIAALRLAASRCGGLMLIAACEGRAPAEACGRLMLFKS